MTINLDSTRADLVSTEVFWIPIDATTPRGAKCLVIDSSQGIAYLREFWPGHGWSHYYPLPRLPKETK